MPLSPIQRAVMQLLAAQRTPESHVAGGLAINRGADSPRYSTDIDFFHDLAESVFLCAEADAETLARAGFSDITRYDASEIDHGAIVAAKPSAEAV